MSWLQMLQETYEHCAGSTDVIGAKPWPISHVVKKTHVEITLDANGIFRRARTLSRTEAPTLIPATESSAGRTSGMAPHPLCEELSYCAADLPDRNEERHREYVKQLKEWCSSPFAHPKALTVLKYIRAGTLWSDLRREQILPMTVEDFHGKKTKVSDEKVFVRWRVEHVGDPCTGTWEDDTLIEAWTSFDRSLNSQPGFCMATGELQRICQNHSRFIRSSDDGAKLISANDFSGYTFRGRFTDEKDDYEKQVCSVGFEVSQKAHNALRWLIARQGSRNGDQVVVSWAVAGKPIPDPLANTLEILGIADAPDTESTITDTAQAFAIRLNKAMAGYRAKLDATDDIVVMGLDSATPGRMAITFYRELMGSEFLERVQAWHTLCAWPQNFGKESKFVGAPAPREIAEAAYGRWDEKLEKVKVDEKFLKTTVERLLPCIVDGRKIPLDLVSTACRRATNRVGFKRHEGGYEDKWEKCLGIACALFKGYHTERSYQMALEPDRTTRDYLYGQLLAIADSIESYALFIADEKPRDTAAARLMQRFADHPFTTWRTIELALRPYMSRLKSGSEKPSAFLRKRERLLDEVSTRLDSIAERTSDAALSGEFLLGYHCQRQALRSIPAATAEDESVIITS